MTSPRRGPLTIDLEKAKLPDVPGPAEAAPVTDREEADANASAARALHAAAAGRGGGLLALLGWIVGAIVSLIIGLWADVFLRDLFARQDWLGWLGLGLFGLLGLVLAALVLRELAGLARLKRIDKLRAQAESAAETSLAAPAREVVAGLARLYGDRGDLATAEVSKAARDLADGPAILAEAERGLMPVLDAAAEQAVGHAARRVAAVTALVPMPAIDILVVLVANLRMIRRIAALYGGRAGWLGSWRLMRAVAQHLIASGLVSATDDLLSTSIGGGVLSKLSRRVGEAALNATLTARVGVAAIAVCRPLPFAHRPAPKARGLVLSALSQWRE